MNTLILFHGNNYNDISKFHYFIRSRYREIETSSNYSLIDVSDLKAWDGIWSTLKDDGFTPLIIVIDNLYKEHEEFLKTYYFERVVTGLC